MADTNVVENTCVTLWEFMQTKKAMYVVRNLGNFLSFNNRSYLGCVFPFGIVIVVESECVIFE